MQTGTQKRTNQLIPIRYFEMFGYRMRGLNYRKIADLTGYSHDHVRHVFGRGGVLYEYWREWGEEFRKDVLEETMDMLYAHLPDIVRANIIAAKEPHTMTGVAARRLIFDRVLGRSKTMSIQDEQKPLTLSDWIMEQTLIKKEEERLHGNFENGSK